MIRTALRLPVLTLFLIALLSASSSARAQESFQVLSVDTLGCDSGQFGMTVLRSNLDGGTYTVHTQVTDGPFIYMNEAASISINGTSSWNIFNNFTYGAVPNPGTYPIPAGQTLRLDFDLERPIGTILYSWTLVVDGCDTGNILYNGPTANVPGATSLVEIPTLSAFGLAAFGIALIGAFLWLRRRHADTGRV